MIEWLIITLITALIPFVAYLLILRKHRRDQDRYIGRRPSNLKFEDLQSEEGKKMEHIKTPENKLK